MSLTTQLPLRLAVDGATAAPRAAVGPVSSPRSLNAVLAEHAVELTHQRRRLTMHTGVDGDGAWLQEIEFFTREIIEPELGRAAVQMYGPDTLQGALEAVTARYVQSRVCFELDDEFAPFEHRVADALEDLGWETALTNGTGRRQLDVIASMRDTSVLIHCVYCPGRIAAPVVLDAYDDMLATGFAHSALIGNGNFTADARRSAAGTRTLLLRPDQLHQLEERLFGTDTWRRRHPERFLI